MTCNFKIRIHYENQLRHVCLVLSDHIAGKQGQGLNNTCSMFVNNYFVYVLIELLRTKIFHTA